MALMIKNRKYLWKSTGIYSFKVDWTVKSITALESVIATWMKVRPEKVRKKTCLAVLALKMLLRNTFIVEFHILR